MWWNGFVGIRNEFVGAKQINISLLNIRLGKLMLLMILVSWLPKNYLFKWTPPNDPNGKPVRFDLKQDMFIFKQILILTLFKKDEKYEKTFLMNLNV